MPDFFDVLTAQTEATRTAFFSTPMLLEAAQNGVERGLYINYLTEAYHHVRHTCPLLAAALGRCGQGDEMLREALIEYIDDEKGHERWILNDIEAIGGANARSAACSHEGSLAVRAMVGYVYYAIDRISPYAMLGMVFVLEGTSVDIASIAAGSIAKRLDIPPTKGFSYLTSHGAVDQDHIRFYRDLVNKIDCPEKQAIIIDTANMVYRLWGQMFNDLVVEWESGEQAHAAIGA
jgi:pyrroloquinoline quinone (PQQ) biosynthesis protein C